MSATGYLGSVGAPDWLKHEVDLWFLADVARAIQWDARFEDSLGLEPQSRELHQQVASGTVDTLHWVLGVVLVSPTSGQRFVDRSQHGLVDELEVTIARRGRAERESSDWYYLGGVADALEFSLGLRRTFWWVPLPASLIDGPPRRDEHGFSA
ncbi:hypothetical protein [Kineosporia sp. R_H_3]|uniref:hypothetical protein n=1 Tax=Kineosporia sp. R_H_3 TaxID=1961848 RepID=UPI000B4AB85A|nr:hypothetical protein [Kineosporia sp. R_H_3]